MDMQVTGGSWGKYMGNPIRVVIKWDRDPWMLFPKNRGKTGKPSKMDGENNGKSYFLMDDLGIFPYFWKHPYWRNETRQQIYG